MPFPINIFPSSDPALPTCEPQTAQGGAAPSSADAAASFSSLLNQAGVPSANPAGPGRCVPPPLYPGSPYMPAVGTATAQPSICNNPAPQLPGEESAEDIENDPGTDIRDQAAVVLEYQLIAGQWVPQQPTQLSCPPPPAADPEGTRAASDPADYEQTQPAASRLPSAACPKETFAKATSDSLSSTTNAVPAEGILNAASGTPSGWDKPVAPGEPGKPSVADTPAAKFVAQNDTHVTLPPTISGRAAAAAEVSSTSAAAEPENSAIDVTSDLSTQVVSAFAGEISAPRPAGHAAQGRTNYNLTEKFAGPDRANLPRTVLGVKSPDEAPEKTTLNAGIKALTDSSPAVGTPAANREDAMPYSAASKPSAPDLASIPGMAHTAAGTSGMEHSLATTRTSIGTPAQASQIVREIRDIGERVSAVEQRSVEVRFDFNEIDRLSVRVEYRDGTVHTTFRANSPELRETIAHEWQAQAASAEQRTYRVAEPIFTAGDSGRDGSSFTGDSSDRKRASEQQNDAASYFPGGPVRAGTSDAVPAGHSSPRIYRPETSLHLHTFA